MQFSRIYSVEVDNKTGAYFFYSDERREAWTLIENDVYGMPMHISMARNKGIRVLGPAISWRMLACRVVPPERVNIAQILRENGLKQYDEIDMLDICEGRSGYDDASFIRIEDEKEKNRLVCKLEEAVKGGKVFNEEYLRSLL